MAAKYKNPPIWAKFGFQVDYDVANWYLSLVCYGGQFESKMATRIQNPPIWAKFCFQVDFDVGNWYSWFGSHIMIHFVGISTVVCGSFWGGWTNSKWWPLTKVQNGRQIQKSSDLGEIWFPSTVEFAYNEVSILVRYRHRSL